MSQTGLRIGVAGCGAMGRPMAETLIAAGETVFGFDVRKLDDFDVFCRHMFTCPKTFAAEIDVLISVVRDRQQTLNLLFDDQALLHQDQKPMTVVFSSTLSPNVVREVADRLPAGMNLIDAPMSGAPTRARSGTLTFMVGGEDAEVARLMPLFEIMGDTVHHLGALGTGMTAKVLNNFVGVTGVVAVRKALASARALGLSERRLLDIMRVSSGSTWYGDNLEKIDWAAEGYDPSNTIGILEKDVGAYLDALDGGPGEFERALVAAIRAMEPLRPLS